MADTLTAPPPTAAPPAANAATNAPRDGATARVTTAPSRDGAPTGAPGETVIEIRNLSKVYRDFWGRKKGAGR